VIGPDGWQVVSRAPVRLRRPAGLLALPEPVPGGSLDELWPLLNVREEDRVLVAAWLLMCLHPGAPYPALCLHGEQGSAKSTVATLLRELVDPSSVPLSRPPRLEDDLIVTARNSLVVALDNVSHVEPWLADALCRLLTGGGLTKRQLYTDLEQALCNVRRPRLLTGIPEVATAPDLADRCIFLDLPPIEGSKRLTEADVRGRFLAARPRLLGALLTAASTALRLQKGRRPADLTRMADFELWVRAGEEALGFTPGTFAEAYRRNRSDSAVSALDGSPVAAALQQWLAGLASQRWVGTSRDLLEEFERGLGSGPRPAGWPRSPRGLSGALRRLAPALRQALGVELVFGERGGDEKGSRLVEVRLDKARIRPSGPSGPSEDEIESPF
jgi:hypothetical protein